MFQPSICTTKIPVRLSRNRNSEYLPQRRKGRKVRRLRVKIIYKSFCPFPITLAPLRLGGRNSRLRVLSMPDYLRRPRKFLTIVYKGHIEKISALEFRRATGRSPLHFFGTLRSLRLNSFSHSLWISVVKSLLTAPELFSFV